VFKVQPRSQCTRGVATGGISVYIPPKSVYLKCLMWLFCHLDPFIPTQIKFLATPLQCTLRVQTLLSVQCNAMHIMHWAECKITYKRPSVRPASVDNNVTLFVDRSSPNLERGFAVCYRGVKFFCAVQSEVVYAHARSSIDRHLQLLSSCYTND